MQGGALGRGVWRVGSEGWAGLGRDVRGGRPVEVQAGAATSQFSWRDAAHICQCAERVRCYVRPGMMRHKVFGVFWRVSKNEFHYLKRCLLVGIFWPNVLFFPGVGDKNLGTILMQ